MRAISLAICAACVLPAAPSHAAAGPATADDGALLNIEALSASEPDRWGGRHHYLYDEEYPPNSTTVGSSPCDGRSCASQPVRMRRSDGTTVVRRIRRCV
jgi:hypothetical protein